MRLDNRSDIEAPSDNAFRDSGSVPCVTV